MRMKDFSIPGAAFAAFQKNRTMSPDQLESAVGTRTPHGAIVWGLINKFGFEIEHKKSGRSIIEYHMPDNENNRSKSEVFLGSNAAKLFAKGAKAAVEAAVAPVVETVAEKEPEVVAPVVETVKVEIEPVVVNPVKFDPKPANQNFDSFLVDPDFDGGEPDFSTMNVNDPRYIELPEFLDRRNRASLNG